jgi:tRNA (guanosine-2'-O-)-methyltransferase
MHRHTSRVVVLATGALATGLTLALFGCGGATKPTPATPDALQHRAKHVDSAAGKPFGGIEVSADAEAVQVTCDAGAYEQCNALDDDCNGIIDDECGYETGAVQITVAWNTGADIDLYVTDPSGSTLYYNEQHDRSRIGGHHDHNARGDCRREQQNPRIENAYWPAPIHAGRYKIVLHYFSPCDRGASTTVATLSVAVGAELLGTYRYKLEPEQRIDALSFDVH